MKNTRWGLLYVLAAGVLATCGCNQVPRLISASEYKTFRTLAGLNRRLMNENKNLRAQLETEKMMGRIADEGDLLKMLRGELESERARIRELEEQHVDLAAEAANLRARLGDLPPGVTVKAIPLLGVGVNIPGNLLFDSGSATLKKSGSALITKVAQIDAIQNPGNLLRICGFTDSEPIKRSRASWESNHHLSSMRAHAVFTTLKKAGIDTARMHTIGFGPNMRVMEGGKENKKLSRRVEIYWVPKAAEKLLPE